MGGGYPKGGGYPNSQGPPLLAILKITSSATTTFGTRKSWFLDSPPPLETPPPPLQKCGGPWAGAGAAAAAVSRRQGTLFTGFSLGDFH